MPLAEVDAFVPNVRVRCRWVIRSFCDRHGLVVMSE